MSAVLSLNDILVRPDVWRGRLAEAAVPAQSSGFPVLDAELPGGGWPRGALTEILVDGAGLGECSLLMPALNAMREAGRWSVLIAPPYAVHAPAWAAAGVDFAHLAVVSPSCRRDVLWAAEQALSGGAVGAVLCWAARVEPAQIRRLQVAASGSATLAFLFRSTRARTEASAAPLRLLLSAGSHGRLAVDLLKRRGQPCGRTLYLDVPRPLRWNDDHAVARAASAASSPRSQRPFAVA